jgi:N-acetylneuraminic acid mutarotase
MPSARCGAAAGVIKGKVYVVGGATGGDGSVVLNVNEIYDPKGNTWNTGAPMPTARWVPASAVVNDILYVIGGCTVGCDGADALSVVEAYDPATNTWSTKSPLPNATGGAYAVSVNGIIYVVGGTTSRGRVVGTVYNYNPATDTWAQDASMIVARAIPAVGTWGTVIVASGGWGKSGLVRDNERYRVKKNSWKTSAPDPAERDAACFAGIAGRLYVAGGYGSEGTTLDVAEAYGLKTDSWATLAPMPQTVDFPGSADVDDRLYCFGGFNGANPFGFKPGVVFDYVQIYQP